MRQGLICGAVLTIDDYRDLPRAPDVKIAYVDVQRALNECNNGKRAPLQHPRPRPNGRRPASSASNPRPRDSRTNSTKKAC